MDKEREFTPANPDLDKEAVMWREVPENYSCRACSDRGGWLPLIDQSDCPACYGDDPYGDGSYCGECQYCCGC